MNVIENLSFSQGLTRYSITGHILIVQVRPTSTNHFKDTPVDYSLVLVTGYRRTMNGSVIHLSIRQLGSYCQCMGRLTGPTARKLSTKSHWSPRTVTETSLHQSRLPRSSRHYVTQRNIRSSPGRERNPLLRATVFIATFGLVSFGGLRLYDKVFGKQPDYPPDVADKLREAIHFSIIENDSNRSFKAFKEATALADDHGMDKHSREYLGILIRVGEMFEHHGLHTDSLTWHSKLVNMGFEYFITDLVQAGVLTNDTLRDFHSATSIQNLPWDSEDVGKAPSESFIESLSFQIGSFIASRRRPKFGAWSSDSKLMDQKIAIYKTWLGTMDKVGTMSSDRNDFDIAIDIYTSLLNYNRVLVAALLPYHEDEASSNQVSPFLSPEEEMAIRYRLGFAFLQSSRPRRNIRAFQEFQQVLHALRTVNGEIVTCKDAMTLQFASLARSSISQKYGVDFMDLGPDYKFPDDEVVMSPEVLAVEMDDALDQAIKLANLGLTVASNVRPSVRDADCDRACMLLNLHLTRFTSHFNNPDYSQAKKVEAQRTLETISKQVEKMERTINSHHETKVRRESRGVMREAVDLLKGRGEKLPRVMVDQDKAEPITRQEVEWYTKRLKDIEEPVVFRKGSEEVGTVAQTNPAKDS